MKEGLRHGTGGDRRVHPPARPSAPAQGWGEEARGMGGGVGAHTMA